LVPEPAVTMEVPTRIPSKYNNKRAIDKQHYRRACNRLVSDDITTLTWQRLLYNISIVVLCCYCGSSIRSSLLSSSSFYTVSAFHATTITTGKNTASSRRERIGYIRPNHIIHNDFNEIATTTIITTEVIRLQRIKQQQQNQLSTSSSTTSSTSLHMFMGSDGGLLGIGGPEAVSFCFFA
jgi:hypothetical protein